MYTVAIGRDLTAIIVHIADKSLVRVVRRWQGIEELGFADVDAEIARPIDCGARFTREIITLRVAGDVAYYDAIGWINRFGRFRRSGRGRWRRGWCVRWDFRLGRRGSNR